VISKMGRMTISEVEAWEACLAQEGESSTEKIPMHVSVLCVEQDTPLTFLPPVMPSDPSVPKAPGPMPLFSDASSSTYAVYPHLRLRMLAPNDQCFWSETKASALEDTDGVAPDDSVGLLPFCTAYLIHIPAGARTTLVPVGVEETSTELSVLQINAMLAWASESSTLGTWRRSMLELQRDWVSSFNELAVLARERWNLSTFGALPFHLVAVEIMSIALDFQGDLESFSQA